MTAGKCHLDGENRNHLAPLPTTDVPQGRAGDVRDMAGATLFLCGRGGFYCNGAVVVMDGGWLKHRPQLLLNKITKKSFDKSANPYVVDMFVMGLSP